MKMYKRAAALAAALILTTGLSAQAANLEGTFTGDLAYENESPKTAETTVSFTGEQVAASLAGQDLNVGAVTATGATVNGPTQVNGNFFADGAGGEYHLWGSETGITAQAGNSALTITNADGTTITGNATVNGDATVNGNTTVNGHFTAQTEDFTVTSGTNNVYVTNNGIQLNNGEHSLYVNESGSKVEGGFDVEGGLTADTVESTVVKGDYGMFGDTVISANEGIVMNKTTTAADGSTETEEVFKVDKDGNMKAESVATDHLQSATGGAITVDSPLLGGEANFSNVNADKVDANTGSFGELTVGGTNVGTTLTQHGAAIADNAAAIAQNTTAIANNSQRIDSLSGRVNDLDGEIENVGAISAALAGLHPLSYDGTGSKFQLAAAMGSYEGTQAAAIGGFYHFNEDIMMSVGGATAFDGDNDAAFNVGVSFRVGQGSSGKKVNSDDVLAQLNAMNEKIAALEAENQSLSEKVAALEGTEAAPAEAE